MAMTFWDERFSEEDFAHLEIASLQKCNVELNEGRYHRGAASVIRMLASA
jgi:hypothetical protein